MLSYGIKYSMHDLICDIPKLFMSIAAAIWVIQGK